MGERKEERGDVLEGGERKLSGMRESRRQERTRIGDGEERKAGK